ncbi:hypothetical protein [Paenibacillus naphthalenovorans]|uniref:hypothetical protein n=1 Tax=Paenibacillus naphthalenovorans TaxID=162209 RepID=UPI00088065F9|nr:hypothetical protein [Paenibacillus naphthalenovorans]SDJ87471.1 hypothetical protein SAMN05421868_1522 [Paenibacillus naphthalenovorans]
MNRENLLWSDIYSVWKFYVGAYMPTRNNATLFHQFHIDVQRKESPHFRLGSGIIDWYPSNKVEERIQMLEQYGIIGCNWKTTTGLIRTAEILWEVKDDEEKVAMTWIAASLNEILQFFPEQWRREGAYSSITKVCNVVQSEMNIKNVGGWHGRTKNFLPVSVDKHIYSFPDNINNLIHIAVLDYLVNVNSWSLVYITS